MKKRILIIDDDIDICTLLSRFLSKEGYETDVAYTGSKGVAKFKESNFDVVLCDYRLGDKDGRDVLAELKAINPQAVVLIITGYSDIKTAVEVIKLGAYDYITKPLIPAEVLNVISSSLKNSQTAVKSSVVTPAAASTSGNTASAGTPAKKITVKTSGEYLVGESEPTKELYRQIEIIAPTNYSIILYGESGTGKEVIARTVHQQSSRRDKPFIAMDCGTLSKELAGSEMFGHVKGAFTGALADKDRHFEMANGGTLFLAEVANLGLDIQATLLRVIQERKFKRVGGTKEMDLDIRIIVASNENLQEAYHKGKFREDLYHRFNEFSINLPPLRQRKQDIPLFAQFFLDKTNEELHKNVEGFDEDVMNMFMNYPWPGNLREFRNVVRRAVLLTTGNKITSKTLPWEITNTNIFSKHSDTPAAVQPITTTSSPLASKDIDLKDAAAKAEYETIMNLLKEVNNNKSKAAEILKIDRKTLYNKIKSYEESKE